jgi:Arc/MetJ family transcription regulator
MRTDIDIDDDDALRLAAEELGTTSKVATVKTSSTSPHETGPAVSGVAPQMPRYRDEEGHG